MERGHGERTWREDIWREDMERGHGERTWREDMERAYGEGTWSEDMERGHGEQERGGRPFRAMYSTAWDPAFSSRHGWAAHLSLMLAGAV